MSGTWDSNLKRLVEADPQSFIGWLLGGATYVREMSVHLNRGIYIDILYEVVLDGESVLIHIEFQRHEEEEMARRVLEYNAYATYKFDRPVASFVLYLKRSGKIAESPLVKCMPDGTEIWRFNFTNVKLWEVPTDLLKKVGDVGVLPLLVLTRDGAHPAIVDEALEGIESSLVDRNTKDNLLTITLTLAALTLTSPEHQDWLRKRFYMWQDLIKETEIYQLIMQEGVQQGVQQGIEQGVQQGIEQGVQQGIEQGVQQGIEQGVQQGIEQEIRREVERLQELILYTCRVRFSDVSALATKKVSGITDISNLNKLVMDLIVTESSEQARRILENLGQTERH